MRKLTDEKVKFTKNNLEKVKVMLTDEKWKRGAHCICKM